jgi:beta-lactamase class A
MTRNDIPITVREYSLFLRVLFNASYLNIEDSEYCTGLLSQSDFDKGLLSGLPAGTRVAHKFGEAGDTVNAHFSEAGIIYLDNNPYLITVMTKGRDPKLLPAVVANISRTIFNLSRTL